MGKKLQVGLAYSLAALMVVPVARVTHAQEIDGSLAAAAGEIRAITRNGSRVQSPVEEAKKLGRLAGVLGYRSPVGTNDRFVSIVESMPNLYTNSAIARYGVYGVGRGQVREVDFTNLSLAYLWLENVQPGAGEGLDEQPFGGGYKFRLRDLLNLRLDNGYLGLRDIDIPDIMLNYDGYKISAVILFNF